ncbi:hypothetical protein CCHR01_00204 [Colletotrichum chrysophilum]|uniref:Transposase n=1 Tax=Colletotrichum chrysophilum TaxID=1836956 RepID=A0AAD9EQC3_9PEZI|nr:hypothetical protein CCHR01_00204 [Colletotrichum chrysophilum]
MSFVPGSITHSKSPSRAQREEMKPKITEIWLHRAYTSQNLVEILRREYGFMATYVTRYWFQAELDRSDYTTQAQNVRDSSQTMGSDYVQETSSFTRIRAAIAAYEEAKRPANDARG